MTVNSTSGLGGSAGINALTTPSTPQKTLGQDAFLRLLITQLENQDPTKPKDDTEFIAQLATFSQLEKLTEISASLKTLTAQLTSGTSGAADSTDPA